MNLIESLREEGNVRGVTLNSQQINVLNLVERENATDEIYKYLTEILLASKMKSKSTSTTKKISKIIDEKSKVTDKDKFKKFIWKNKMQIRANWDSKERLQKALSGEEIEPTYIDEILDMKKYFEYQTHGILTFLVDNEGHTIDTDKDYEEILKQIDKEKTMQKVRALKEYITGTMENNEQRFNRLTLDGQGKFGTVAGIVDTEIEANATPENYNLLPLRDGYEFAKANGMNIRINALVFFKDFPDRLVGASKEEYRTALINYGKAIASIAKEYEEGEPPVPTTIDLFNEFIDYFDNHAVRTNAWMSKLSVEDLCEIGLAIKQEMPNADFGYNDWNFENPHKREAIFGVIKRIQDFEQKKGVKLITHIGTQCHININDIENNDLGISDALKKSIEDLQQFGLPIDITELDISKGLDGIDYELDAKNPELMVAIKKYEQKLQNDIMKYLSDCVKEGKIRGITAWSLTDEVCADICKSENEPAITGMSYNPETGLFSFYGKDMDVEIEMTEHEMELIKTHRDIVKENQAQNINNNPIQDFSYHNHTQRCGHGAQDTGDEEFVQNAIKGGLRKIAFTDHIPMPDGLNKRPNNRMDIAEVESYLQSINTLKEQYSDIIEIESGFEFEYARTYKGVNYLDFLRDMKSKTDKMVLGQHWVIDSNGKQQGITRGEGGEQIDDKVLVLYADSICEAMEEGVPDIIAHPDLFMKARDEFGEDEKNITEQICKKAIEKGIPLEINFGELAKYSEREEITEEKASISYPSKAFWEFVANYSIDGKRVKVVFGKDAHYPGQLSSEKDYEIAKDIIGMDTLSKLQFVKEDLQTPDFEINERLEGIDRGKIEVKELVQESIDDIPNLALLDEIQAVEQKENARSEKEENMTNIGE